MLRSAGHKKAKRPLSNEQGRRRRGRHRAVIHRIRGKDVNLADVDEIPAPDMLLNYSRHEPRRGRDDIKASMTGFGEGKGSGQGQVGRKLTSIRRILASIQVGKRKAPRRFRYHLP
jgi:hypothetical protein